MTVEIYSWGFMDGDYYLLLLSNTLISGCCHLRKFQSFIQTFNIIKLAFLCVFVWCVKRLSLQLHGTRCLLTNKEIASFYECYFHQRNVWIDLNASFSGSCNAILWLRRIP